MKTIKTTLICSLLLICFKALGFSQNLDLLPQHQRDSILIAISKEAVLKYGPGYYRENMEAKIERKETSKKGQLVGENANRVYYWVKLFIDPKDAVFDWGFAARVKIWADSRKPAIAQFGNGFSVLIPEVELRNSNEIKKIPYQPY